MIFPLNNMFSHRRRVVLMGRVLVPSTKGTSLPSGSNGREKPRVSRSRVHVVCLVVSSSDDGGGGVGLGMELSVNFCRNLLKAYFWLILLIRVEYTLGFGGLVGQPYGT